MFSKEYPVTSQQLINKQNQDFIKGNDPKQLTQFPQKQQQKGKMQVQ